MILETLRSIPVPDVHHDLRRVLAIISRLGEDSGMTGTKMCVCVAQNNHHYHNNNAGSRLVLDGDKKRRRPLMDGFQSVVSISLPSFQARTRFVSNLRQPFRNAHDQVTLLLLVVGWGEVRDYSYL